MEKLKDLEEYPYSKKIEEIVNKLKSGGKSFSTLKGRCLIIDKLYPNIDKNKVININYSERHNLVKLITYCEFAEWIDNKSSENGEIEASEIDEYIEKNHKYDKALKYFEKIELMKYIKAKYISETNYYILEEEDFLDYYENLKYDINQTNNTNLNANNYSINLGNVEGSNVNINSNIEGSPMTININKDNIDIDKLKEELLLLLSQDYNIDNNIKSEIKSSSKEKLKNVLSMLILNPGISIGVNILSQVIINSIK